MIKYKVVKWSAKPISAVKVDRETEKSVWVRGSRLAKVSSYHWFSDSWEEAKEHLLREKEERVERCRIELEMAERELASIRHLEKPEGAQ